MSTIAAREPKDLVFGIILVAAMVLAGGGVSRAEAPSPSGSTTSPGTTLESLFHELAKSPGIQARFAERKELALLKVPLESAGVVYFSPPGLLARHTESPVRSSLYLDDRHLTVVEDGRKRTLDLQASAFVAALAGSFVDVLRGDRAAVQRRFAMKFDPTTEGWQLTLSPRSIDLRKAIRELRFTGKGIEVQTMTLLETNGDRSITTFTQVDPARRFTPDERARLLFPAK